MSKAADVMRKYTDRDINRFFLRVYGKTWQELAAEQAKKGKRP